MTLNCLPTVSLLYFITTSPVVETEVIFFQWTGNWSLGSTYLMFFYVFPILFSLQWTPPYIPSPLSPTFSVWQQMLESRWVREKPGDGAIGGWSCRWRLPHGSCSFVRTYFLLGAYTGDSVCQLKGINLTGRKKEEVEEEIGLSLSKSLDPM